MRTCYLSLFAGCVLLSACSLVTEALRSVGVPISDGAREQSGVVDEAIAGWVMWLLGIATTEVPRATVKVTKHVKAKRAARTANGVAREKIVADLMQKAAAKAGIAPAP